MSSSIAELAANRAPVGRPPRTNGFAIASLVLGIVSVVVLAPIAAIAAIVVGRSARRRIQASSGAEDGEGLAQAGVVLGAVGLALFVVAAVSFAVLIDVSGRSLGTAAGVGLAASVVVGGILAARFGSRRVREAALGYLLVLPSLIVFGTFVFYPFFRNFQLSLYEVPPFPNLPKRYVGFEQFQDVLGSHEFRNSLKVTLLFAVMSVPTGIILGLALAVLAHQRLRGIGVYRTIFSSTVATSVAVASVIFFTLLDSQIGLLNYVLGREGAISLLDDPKWALPSVAMVTVWQNIGISFILMSAGLQAVPDELLEAARVDGASAWSRFRNVTLPLLSPTLFFATVVGGILAFQAFGQIDLLTQGGPGDHTNVLVYAIYTNVFKSGDEGQAAVLAIALFVITLLLTLVQLRFLERRVQYER
jgi:ABC-type sugar transport system permease subunit